MKTKSANEQERELHNSIISGDDIALSKLYDIHGVTVIRILKSRYPRISKSDDALIWDAVNQAFLGYYLNPHTFNPNKNTLLRFLEIASERDLLNILDKEQKHMNKKDLPESVDLQEKFWNSIISANESTDGQLIQLEIMKSIEQKLAKFFESKKDILIAKLILSRERNTEVFAKILGIEKSDVIIQRGEVKKHKDRIKKVIERNDLEQKIKAILE